MCKLQYFEWYPPWQIIRTYFLAYKLELYMAYIYMVTPFYLTFFLACTLAFYPTFFLAFYLASIQTVSLASCLASILRFYLAFFLTFYLACVRVRVCPAWSGALPIGFRFVPAHTNPLFWLRVRACPDSHGACNKSRVRLPPHSDAELAQGGGKRKKKEEGRKELPFISFH